MKQIVISLLLLLAAFQINAKNLSSPSGELSVALNTGDKISLDIMYNGNRMFLIKDICMVIDNGTMPAKNAKLSNIKITSHNAVVEPAIKEINGRIVDKYNEAIYSFSDGNKIAVRLYDNGIAYRIIGNNDKDITVYDEPTEFVFDTTSTFIYQQPTFNNCEFPYITSTIGQMPKDAISNFPMLVKLPTGENVVFLESDCQDYPVLWLKKGDNNLKAHFWKCPKTLKGGSSYYDMKGIATYEEYIAKTSGNREFPWRAFAFAKEDKELLSNQITYLLAPKCRIEDISWIKPGWVTFDWWAKHGIYGVDFESGVNTETAKYMIDFASKYGIRYFLFDDGWTLNNNLTTTIPQLNIKEVTAFAKEKNVDVMLWIPYSLLDDQMDEALDKFSEWGIKGIKIDFMDRDDQIINKFYWRAAQLAAEHKMVIDFHGAYRPDGLRRAYPNVLTREGLMEFEFNGSANNENPRHHCLLPFIRSVAGPADYIPGTMNNSTLQSFRPNGATPMGIGTRTHAMAMAVIVTSPMQMLPDSPSDYYKEDECTKFLVNIPVEWDQTIPLDCKIEEYVSVARRYNNQWYVAAITNFNRRSMTIDLSFLDSEKFYKVELFRDGANADKIAKDYVHESKIVQGGTILNVDLAPGGAWLAKIVETQK